MPRRCQAIANRVVVVKPEQRALQHGREREIVLRQQQRVGQHHQVHDGDVLGEHQPVGARDRDAGVLQRADDRLEQRPALAHQHQHVAGAQRRCVIQRRDMPRRSSLASADLRARLRQRVERRVPGFDLGLLVGLDRAATSRRGRAPRRAAAGAPASPRRPTARASPPAVRTRRRPRRARWGRSGTSTGNAHAAVHARRRCESARKARACSSNSRGAAPWKEKIDCFSSPTAKIVRRDLPRARAGEELGGQTPDDLPLLRARVLRLVDQHVIDAVVELVVHPGGALLAQQRERLVDQVVVVEQAAPVLLGLVARDHRVRDGQQRRGAIAAGDGVAPLEQARTPGRAFRETIGEVCPSSPVTTRARGFSVVSPMKTVR